ncbi:hypothetical protein YWIDRAFT_01619 [Streptomyces sp. SceaMP-e96]|uniref:hypothetical protein n=1 Tax=unclassified Streptomyces TaxID=2593676 RepID=UPI000823E446|nr:MULTISPECIES: hypothetical protein [unclassified Streptomyces]MYT12369.1 hypothetical protein [Streptomyces sp. SID4951]SCK29361.1 hypothetical protein YWIDRAFT_01619 [Streptomyces sp. SceaMP-e96]
MVHLDESGRCIQGVGHCAVTFSAGGLIVVHVQDHLIGAQVTQGLERGAEHGAAEAVKDDTG